MEGSPKQLEQEAAGAIKLTCNRWCAILQPCFVIYASWICSLVLAPCTLQTAKPAEKLLLWCGAAALPCFTPSFAASWVNEMINWRSLHERSCLTSFSSKSTSNWNENVYNEIKCKRGRRSPRSSTYHLSLSCDQKNRSNFRIFGGHRFCVVTCRKPFKCSYLTVLFNVT